MTMLIDYWPILGTMVATIVWLVRLEGSVKDVKHDALQQRATIVDLSSKNTSIAERMARIETKLDFVLEHLKTHEVGK